jgi:hypothetical protein
MTTRNDGMAPRMAEMAMGMVRFAVDNESDRCLTCTSETERRSGAANDDESSKGVTDRTTAWTSGW